VGDSATRVVFESRLAEFEKAGRQQ